MRAHGSDVPKIANEIKKAVSKEFLINVVQATPVDTGKARSNWNTQLGGPDYSIRPTEGRSGDGAMQRGSRVISQAQIGQGIHITNALPYIQRLNDGWSKQAPIGYIQKARDAARVFMSRIKWSAYRKAAK